MKFAWRTDLVDISWLNAQQVEEVDEDFQEFGELLREEKEGREWDDEDLQLFMDNLETDSLP